MQRILRPQSNTYIYDVAGTYNLPIPAGLNNFQVFMCDAGGGGGSGRRGAPGTARFGGGGGAGGGVVIVDYSIEEYINLYKDLQLQIIVGAGGAGGAAVTTNDTNGNAGGSGDFTFLLFRGRNLSNNNLVQIDQVLKRATTSGGAGGTASAAAGGTASTLSMFTGTNGASSSGTAVPSAPTGSIAAATGGGAGGGISTANVPFNGGFSGVIRRVLDTSITTGFSLASASTTGDANFQGDTSSGQLKGFNLGVPTFGGGASTAGKGGMGSSSYRGAGGAGGGASANGFNSGAGTKGGDALVIVSFY